MVMAATSIAAWSLWFCHGVAKQKIAKTEIKTKIPTIFLCSCHISLMLFCEDVTVRKR